MAKTTKTIQATITKNTGLEIFARVRRSCRTEQLAGYLIDQQIISQLKPGMRIEVRRETNNPYLVFVKIVENDKY